MFFNGCLLRLLPQRTALLMDQDVTAALQVGEAASLTAMEVAHQILSSRDLWTYGLRRRKAMKDHMAFLAVHIAKLRSSELKEAGSQTPPHVDGLDRIEAEVMTPRKLRSSGPRQGAWEAMLQRSTSPQRQGGVLVESLVPLEAEIPTDPKAGEQN